MKMNSFFALSKAPLSKLLKILNFWGSGANVTEAVQHVEITPKAAVQWYAYARDVFTTEMLLCDMQHEKEAKIPPWLKAPRLLGVWWSGSNRQTWLAKDVYGDGTKRTLSKCINKYIKLRTLIITDQFKSHVTEVTSGHSQSTMYIFEKNEVLAGMQCMHQ
ncbi:hypothetical protein P3T76_014816 [Phytophthora citrophthora]|uniref:Uncharacterized protein n=1 Tax=Phytophthora citrophthora TaxID=4793 RepID=A0AAD9LAZ7_9STRA|nr:hypothetical protein P3T76_014816 [Phytophthora citrophthora]